MESDHKGVMPAIWEDVDGTKMNISRAFRKSVQYKALVSTFQLLIDAEIYGLSPGSSAISETQANA